MVKVKIGARVHCNTPIKRAVKILTLWIFSSKGNQTKYDISKHSDDFHLIFLFQAGVPSFGHVKSV